MWTRIAVLLLLSTLGASGVSIDIENGVYKLQESTFDTVVSKFPAVMVMFYSPSARKDCEGCLNYDNEYEKAARKLKKIAPSETVGARLAKVDGVAEPVLKKRFAVQAYPTLLVFKGGELFGKYQSGVDKEDFIAYMKGVVAEPAVLGTLLRGYQLGYAAYKELLRHIFPGSVRKHLFKIFPAMLAVPLLPFLLFWVCSRCCPPKKKKVAAKKRGDAKRAKRSASPAPDGKRDEGEAKEEPKNEAEKKKED